MYRSEYDLEDPAPTLILICGFCYRDILFYGEGDERVEDGWYVLIDYEQAVCACGAFYGEGDRLEVRREQEAD